MSLTLQIGPVKSKLIGDIDPVKYAALRYELSYADPNAYFNPAVRKGHSDGRKYLITEKRQEFCTGLAHRIQQSCEALEIEIDHVDDRRPTPEASHFMALRNNVDLYDYQRDAVATLIEARNAVGRLATGAGKTHIIAAVTAALERRTLILVHRMDLVHQVLERLRDTMLYADEYIGQVGGGVYEPNIITVATVQTVAAALGITVKDDKADPDDEHKGENVTGAAAHADTIIDAIENAEVVIVDECHHTPAKTIFAVMQEAESAAWRIGLSATDWRDDNADLLIEACLGPRVVDISLSDLVGWGRLVPATVEMHPMRLPDEPCMTDQWARIYRHYYTENERFHEQVLEQNSFWYTTGRTILTLVRMVNHGHYLEQLHRANDIPTVFLSGSDSQSSRQEVFRDIRAGNLRHLIGTSIADEGLDLPPLDALNLAGGGKSTTAAYQRPGRILRLSPGKERALVCDYRPHIDRGPAKVLKEHAGRRANIYRKEKIAFQFTEFRP